ncbi:hypothetical protein C7N83_13830 [Neisseria iguanae]|uniref:Transposase IS4-like domain-containing protein n=1 Tax=Neisseria iguanae TaxID=90242 RepID=A0A2P7TWR0_9NEIS|nr:hypothetical protein C7N83_13830 [Neisseria iguanae]
MQTVTSTNYTSPRPTPACVILSNRCWQTPHPAQPSMPINAQQSHLQRRRLSDGMIRKAHRGKFLTEEDKQRNKQLSKIRYVVEQTFGVLHRQSGCKRARYSGLQKGRQAV